MEVKVVTRTVRPTARRVRIGGTDEDPLFETQLGNTPEQLQASLQVAVDAGWTLQGVAGLGDGRIIAVLTR